MNFNINFQKAKRNYIVLTFDDERNVDGKTEAYERVLHVGMPKKRIFSAIMDMQEIIDGKAEDQTAAKKKETNEKMIDELYDLTAQILSNNLEKERISTEWVDEQMSVVEIKSFFEQYVKFINGEASSPN